VKAFKERYKKSPTYNAGTYDAIDLLKTAIEEAGTTDADKLVPVIEKTKSVGTGAVLEFDKSHDPVWGIGKYSGIAVQWQNGKKIPFWPTEVKGMQKFKFLGDG
jgi:branched-chain amino acid transport system substrate-binding protein